MFDSLFQGLFDTAAPVIALGDFLLCLGCALLLGLGMALTYMYLTRYTKSFVVTLALLPGVVCMVIMLVNGNVGTGVAVAGAFSLVRFRSVPGTAREICVLFLAMGAGLICGMGYLAYAAVFTLVMCLIYLLYHRLDLGETKNANRYKVLTLVIPEDLDYSRVFDQVLEAYTARFELVRVKTANLGSLYKLTYHIILKDPDKEKEMLDLLRCRNGNLEITLSRQETSVTEL